MNAFHHQGGMVCINLADFEWKIICAKLKVTSKPSTLFNPPFLSVVSCLLLWEDISQICCLPSPLSSLSHTSIIYPGLLLEPASWALHPLQAGLYRGWTFKMDVWSWTSRSHCLPACHSCPLTQLYSTKCQAASSLFLDHTPCPSELAPWLSFTP